MSTSTIDSAIDPVMGDCIPAVDFITRHGAQFHKNRLFPICPACDSPITIAAFSSKKRDTYYRHFPIPDSDENNPLKECAFRSPDKLMKMLEPASWKPEQEERIRRQICQEKTLKQVYTVCCRIFTGMPPAEFYRLLMEAERRKIWRFAHLEIPIIPYLLATLDDVTVHKTNENGSYSYKVRAVLHKPTNQRINCLWEKPGTHFLRVYFVNGGEVGKEIERSPIHIPDKRYCPDILDTSWIKPKTLKDLKEFGRTKGIY